MVGTDRTAYQSGDAPSISGAGYNPGEPLLVQVKHEGGELEEGVGHEPWIVTADQDGNFSTSWYVNPNDSMEHPFLLSVTSVAGQQADMLFTNAASTTVTLNLYDSGWYASNYSTVHDPWNKNYVVGTAGSYSTTVMRNYFVFDLSRVTGRITGATLRASNPYGSGSSRTYTLYDVVTSVSELMNGSSLGTWADLGTGTAYGSQFVSTPTASTISVNFNSAGVAALRAKTGQLFAVGGDYPNSTNYNFLFGWSSGGYGSTAVQLILQVTYDTTPPVITTPGELFIEATSPAGANVTYTVTAVDDFDGPVPVSCTPASGSVFPLDTANVSCSAQDGSGNTADAQFRVTVQDTTAPVISNLPAGLLVEATSAAGATVSYALPTAEDLVDGSVEVLCTPASGERFAFGDTTVSCTSTDSRGNSATAQFNVSVVDTTPPALSVPANMSLTATSVDGAVASYTASASDSIDGALTPTCTKASSSLFAPGTTTVSCSATDAHGNVGTASFTVSVTFDWSDLLTPVNVDGSSIFKLNSTVPVKFRLTGASANITNAVALLYVAKLSDNVIGTELQAESNVAADSGNTFRHSSGDSVYIFNLSTKDLSTGTWQLRVDLGDGVSHTALISLR